MTTTATGNSLRAMSERSYNLARRRRLSSSTARADPSALENVLEAGHYDVVFVESSAHAYSQIKRVQPNLVILCVRIDDRRASRCCRC